VIDAMMEMVYEAMEGSDAAMEYSSRHGIESAAVLTVLDDDMASGVAGFLADRIKGKTVVEIGGGIGLLACHMGMIAKRVYSIEANPCWTWTFVRNLLAVKPKNVSYLFGAADEFAGLIRADVAVICTHSGVAAMKAVGALFAPVVIDVYGEIISSNPEKFDRIARTLRAA